MNRKLPIIFLLALLSCLGRNNQNYQPISERFIQDEDRSCDAVFATRYETKEELLTDFYQNAKYKDSLELNLRLGTYYHYKANYDSALQFYWKAAQIDSSDFSLYYNMSLACSEMNDFQNALIFIDKAIFICGNRWEVLNTKCYVLGKLDRCEQAIEAGLISKQLNPDNLKIYGNLLRCYDKMNQGDSAKRYINQIDSRFGQTTSWVDSLREKYR